ERLMELWRTPCRLLRVRQVEANELRDALLHLLGGGVAFTGRGLSQGKKLGLILFLRQPEPLVQEVPDLVGDGLQVKRFSGADDLRLHLENAAHLTADRTHAADANRHPQGLLESTHDLVGPRLSLCNRSLYLHGESA